MFRLLNQSWLISFFFFSSLFVRGRRDWGWDYWSNCVVGAFVCIISVLGMGMRRACFFVKWDTIRNRSPKGRAAASNIQNRIREKQRRITKIERLSTGIYEDYREGILNEEEYLAIRRQYGAEKEELLKEVDALMLAETEHEADYHSTGSLADIVRKYAEFQELSREIVEAFITDIQVHTDSHEFRGNNASSSRRNLLSRL